MDKIPVNNKANKHIKQYATCLGIWKFKRRPQNHILYSFNWKKF